MEKVEAEYDLFTSGIGGVWQRGNSWMHRRLMNRLGLLAWNVEYRVANNPPLRLPQYTLDGGGRRLGLLAVQRRVLLEVKETFRRTSPTLAVIRTAPDGRTVVGSLPPAAKPGTARVANRHIDGWQHTLAWPVPPEMVTSNSGTEPAPGDMHTVLCDLGRGHGVTSATLGFVLEGGAALAIPLMGIGDPPVGTHGATSEVLRWAHASGTPIV